MSKTLLTLALALCTALAVGCGGDDEEENGGGQSQSGVSLSGSDVAPQVNLRVRKPGKRNKFEESVEAAAGDVIVLRANVANGDEHPTLRFVVPGRRSQEVQVAVAGKDTAPAGQVTIRAEGDDPIQIAQVRYTCNVSDQTFCPVDATSTQDGFELKLVAPSKELPIIFQLQVAKEKEAKRKRDGEERRGDNGGGSEGDDSESS